ncbi:FecR family protein [Tenacibaculum amylolyticum]|uniref:FecR family protein n=1 Tax=Tenacibaculum amylolyticum TaxID=104269 RepID=UPI003892F641
MAEKYDDTFLARWLANELSEKELKDFEASEDYEYYTQIIGTLEFAEFPQHDIAENLNATLYKIEQQKTTPKKARKLYPYWMSGVAAAVIVVFSYLFFFQNIKYTTQQAEHLSFFLPDSSEVVLNAYSKITYSRFNWKNNRKVVLNGEAYFKVKKGQTFQVETEQGTVTVLGTQFIVNNRDNYYNVICYEGKVQVTVSNKTPVILTKGKGYTIKNGTHESYSISDSTPSWIANESSFNNVPILEVINELERQFHITIEGKDNLKPAYFSGRFSHDNVENALKTIFVSMNIPFSFENNKVTIKK